MKFLAEAIVASILADACKDAETKQAIASDMVVVYVAGPYRSNSYEGIKLNIESARNVAVKTAKLGYAIACPHTNTGTMDEIAPEIEDNFWLQSAIAIMKRCDAIVLAPGWTGSEGVRIELNIAKEMGIPVFETVDDLPPADEFHQFMRKLEATAKNN